MGGQLHWLQGASILRGSGHTRCHWTPYSERQGHDALFDCRTRGPVLGMDPCPLSNKACGSIESSPSISTWGTVMNGCGRRRGSSGAIPGCRPACGGAASSRGAADGTLHACGGHIGRCRACDGRSAAGSIAGCGASHVLASLSDQCRAGAGAASDVMEARGRTGFSQRHGRYTVQPCR